MDIQETRHFTEKYWKENVGENLSVKCKQTQVYNKKNTEENQETTTKDFFKKKTGLKQSPLIAQLHFKLLKHVRPCFLWFSQ